MLFRLVLILLFLVSVIRGKKFCDVENGYDEVSAMAALDAHNAFRTKMATGTFKGPKGELSPKAAGMRKMIWSCELQKSAQEKTTKCIMGYTLNGDGENTYAMDSPSLSSRYQKSNGSAKMVSELWPSQYSKNGFGDLKTWGTAFQMAADESYQMGCGYNVCQNHKVKNGVMQHRLYVVCKYSPGKDSLAIGGDTAYKIGKPCSECGPAFKCEKEGGALCIRKKLANGKDVPIEFLPDTIGHCNVVNGYDKQNTEWIVDYHNTYRSAMARGVFEVLNGTQKSNKGSNMKKMYWNCTLQASAQWWAENGNCSGEHSKTGGENIWLGSEPARQKSIDPKLDKRVNGSGLYASKAWPGEFISRGFHNYIYTDKTSHALPMAWADTNQIGCGYHVCKDAPYANGYYWYTLNVVCQYRPTGNVGKQQGYKFGEPCSACDEGFTCEKTGSGLCVPEKKSVK